MASRPTIIAFDVIQTLFSLGTLRPRLADLGLQATALDLWFARILRDGFALAATGTFRPFPDVAAAALKAILAEHGLDHDTGRISTVLNGFAELTLQPDVTAAVEQVRGEGFRIMALTNGSAQTTTTLLQRAGLLRHFEHVTSIDEVGHWKPRAEVYLHAAQTAGVEPSKLALVAAH